MPNKRSRRQVHHFHCPYCHNRLWRLGSPKHHLFYRNKAELQQYLGMTHKKAALLNNQKSTHVDDNRWIEEFFCPQHSKIWLLVTRHQDGSLTEKIACERDWQKTVHTIDPNFSNPSVSEFSYRMSRSGYQQNAYYKHQEQYQHN